MLFTNFKPMKSKLIKVTSLAFFAACPLSNAASVASDNGGNYSSGWTNGSNGGTGFSPWTFTINNGTGFVGAFIGDPSFAGITGMPTSSFGLYANPAGSGASITVSRELTGALAAGQSFSFEWAINWDGDNGSLANKGFNLYAGNQQIINVNNAGNADITINSVNTGFGYGTNPMTWVFLAVDDETLAVSATDRDGTGIYSNTFTVDSAITEFSFYATALAAGDARQPYFNNFQVVPEPSTWMLSSLMALGLVLRRRVRH
jgi:hypothetical protein